LALDRSQTNVKSAAVMQLRNVIRVAFARMAISAASKEMARVRKRG
jgi:hypothetical protein